MIKTVICLFPNDPLKSNAIYKQQLKNLCQFDLTTDLIRVWGHIVMQQPILSSSTLKLE